MGLSNKLKALVIRKKIANIFNTMKWSQHGRTWQPGKLPELYDLTAEYYSYSETDTKTTFTQLWDHIHELAKLSPKKLVKDTELKSKLMYNAIVHANAIYPYSKCKKGLTSILHVKDNNLKYAKLGNGTSDPNKNIVKLTRENVFTNLLNKESATPNHLITLVDKKSIN